MGLISFYYFYSECFSIILALRRSNLVFLLKHDFLSFTTCRFQCYISNIINNADTKVLIKIWSNFHWYTQSRIVKITGKEKKDNHFSRLIQLTVFLRMGECKHCKMVISDHTELSNTYCYTLISVLLSLLEFPWKKNLNMFSTY